MTQVAERGFWHPKIEVAKWDYKTLKSNGLFDAASVRPEDGGLTGGQLLAAGVKPDDCFEDEGNILLTAGITRLLNLLTVAGGQGYNAANARIGAGNGTTAVVIGNTDLSAAAGAANRYFQLVSGAPGVATNVVTFVSTFATGDGNFAWEEWGIDAGSSSGTTVTAPLLNRKVVAMGTKASGASWTITSTITIS